MELIFEIGCEELPASFCEPALDQMKASFREHMATQRIDFDGLKMAATPRRLALLVGGLADTQRDLQEQRTGPPADVGFDDDGQPTPAARGFARGQGVEVDDLYVVDTDKGQYVAADVFEQGAPTGQILPEVLGEIIEGLDFPKSMRWATRPERFGRPVRWILAVADAQVVPVAFAGVDSSNTTRGHRFAAPDSFEVADIDGYLDGLRQAHVVVDPDARRAAIVDQLDRIAADADAAVVDDPELVDEVTYLVEQPHAIAIEFGDDYLELPDEVLTSSMRSHQRYFSLADDDGALISMCAVIYNTPVSTPKQVYDGNLRVLRARLDDARFFWTKDRQTALAERVDQLAEVVWLDKLGSMKDRSERISRLAGAIADELGLSAAARQAAERAGLLSKADLVSGLVGEFPDLQGVMGREYALADGEDPAVARAIDAQYLPGGADGAVPTSPAGSAVALAEKLDALVGCFGIGLTPTSTSDPYGLRRAALGVIRILEARRLRVRMSRLFELAIAAYEAIQPGALEVDAAQLVDQLVDFGATRLKYQLTDTYPTDVVDAVLAAGRNDILSVGGRTEALAELRDEPDFEALALGFKRVVNILRKQADGTAHTAETLEVDLLADGPERRLHDAWIEAVETVDDALSRRDWRRACQALIGLKRPVDAFFDHVMVMADDPALRNNRIALLDGLRTLFLKVADISKIQA